MGRPVEIAKPDEKRVRTAARRRQVSRVKRSVHAQKKRRKVLKEAKGYYGRKHSSYRFAKEQVQRSGMYAYRDRRNRKREFRRLWITRINAAARLEGMSYSRTDPRPQQGRGRGQPQDARRHRGQRPRCVPPICGARPGGCGRLVGHRHSTLPGGPSISGPLFRSRRRKRRQEGTQRELDDRQPPEREAEAGPQAARAQAPRARGAVRDRGRGPARGGPGGRRRAALAADAPRQRPGRRGGRARSCWPRSRRSARGRGRSPSGSRAGRSEPRRPASTCTGSATPATSARSSAPPTRCSTAPSSLGPDCADPFSPKAVRASMGSIFAQPLVRAEVEETPAPRVALVAHGGDGPRGARRAPRRSASAPSARACRPRCSAECEAR